MIGSRDEDDLSDEDDEFNVACSEDELNDSRSEDAPVSGGRTAPLVVFVPRSHAESTAPERNAETPSIEASFFCVETDHSRFLSTFFFWIFIFVLRLTFRI
jgi:hypothetical protein